MRRLMEALERRDQARRRRRLPCSLLVDGRRHGGVVRDLSPGGLFVQTAAELPAGTGAIVWFRTPEGERFVLEATVPHRRRVPRSLTWATSGGVGLCIQDPPKAYLRWAEGRRPIGS